MESAPTSRRYLVFDSRDRFVYATSVPPSLVDMLEDWSVVIGTDEDAEKLEADT